MESRAIKLDLRDLLKTLYRLRDDIDSYIETLEILLNKGCYGGLFYCDDWKYFYVFCTLLCKVFILV